MKINNKFNFHQDFEKVNNYKYTSNNKDLYNINIKDKFEVNIKDKYPFSDNLQDSDYLKLLNEPRNLNDLPDFKVTPFKIGIAVEKKESIVEIINSNLVLLKNNNEEIDLGNFSNKKLLIKNNDGIITVYDDKNKIVEFNSGKLLIKNNLIPPYINSKSYRGDFEIILNPKNINTFHIINNVMLEEYLRGVVPSESPSTWPEESLKAQALAARTYAVANWNKRKEDGFDLADTVADQVYNGISAETQLTDKAIKETEGKIIIFNGKPINALFFSCSGGYTDSAMEVWNIDLPYIQPVQDFDYKAPKYKWEKTYSNSDIKKALLKLNVNIGNILEIEPIEFTQQKRVKKIKFRGTNGEEIIDSNKFRMALGLNSTLWSVKANKNKKFNLLSKNYPKSFTFNGGGWGHALGMSQWGARQMAEDGKSYEEIIKHYYKGIEIVKMYK